MLGRMIENNKVKMVCKIVSGFTYSHEVFGEKFYLFDGEVVRKSGQEDIIPVMVSERLLDVTMDLQERFVRVEGQFRSYNKLDGDRKHLILSVFASEIGVLEGEHIEEQQIYLNGYICKRPIYRTTPLGREIADVLLAVNRPNIKSDYIPCICWGRNAAYVAELPVGTNIEVVGRIQSRQYIKRLSDTESESRTAYEVSIHMFKQI